MIGPALRADSAPEREPWEILLPWFNLLEKLQRVPLRRDGWRNDSRRARCYRSSTPGRIRSSIKALDATVRIRRPPSTNTLDNLHFLDVVTW